MRVRFMAVLAVVAVLGAACGGGGHQSPSSGPQPTTGATSTTTSPAPSPRRTGPLSTGPGVQPGEKPPVLGTAAKQHTPAGALAFAEYYMRALDWSFATNDPYLLKQISSPTCPACDRYIAALDGLAQSEHLTGSRITIISDRLVTGTFKVKSDAVVEFVLNDEAAVLVKPSAPPTTVAPAVSHDESLVFVSWMSGAWKIVEEGSPS